MRKSILLIDDDRAFIELLALWLRERDVRVDIATGGREALDILAERTPDLIVLDILMAGMSGVDVLTQLRKQNIDVPVIVLTNLNYGEMCERCLELGARECFTKSVMSLKKIGEDILARIGKRNK